MKGFSERNVSDDGVNVILIRDGMCQEYFIVIDNNSWCELFKDKVNDVCWDTADDWIESTNTRIDYVLYTDVLVQIQFHPYINFVGWIETGGDVEDHSSAASVHMSLTTTSTTAAAKKSI